MSPQPLLEIHPVGPAQGVVRAPASKSHEIRALICAALARGESVLRGGGFGDDVRATEDALDSLGVERRRAGGGHRILGAIGRPPASTAELDLRGSGTALRLLTAVCALGPGPYVLSGDASLSGRPVGAIAESLRELGLSIEADAGCPPISVRGGPPVGGATVRVDGSASSHPVSALLLLAPHLVGGLTILPGSERVSWPYVGLTREVLEQFGASVEALPEEAGWRVAGGGLRAAEVEIEGDWSSAAFLLGAAAATRGRVTVRGLRVASHLADRAVLDVLRGFGAEVAPEDAGVTVVGRELRGVEVDLGPAPDLAPVVGALGCLAAGETVVSGAPHLRTKETDRIAAVVRAARALGCEAEERADGFLVRGGGVRGGTVDPEGDHRLAMAFSLVGTAAAGVRIADPGCVAKSFPGFWTALGELGVVAGG